LGLFYRTNNHGAADNLDSYFRTLLNPECFESFGRKHY
jgi:hypothetical protein